MQKIWMPWLILQIKFYPKYKLKFDLSCKVPLSIDHRDMDKQPTQYNWSYVCLTKEDV